jgi:hypothetical protein
MSSIGIVVRADKDVDALERDWVPVPFGPRQVVEAVVAELMSNAGHLRLMANIEGPEESPDPRSISFSGVWGDEERAVLRRICSRLNARFYDAEECDFISL